MIEGILLVNKPVDWTSFDVVNFLRSMIARHYEIKPSSFKIGHTGTLDPFAEGLLVILIGKNYTKKMTEFMKLNKSYQATMKLGDISDTGDVEGRISFVSNFKPERINLEKVFQDFIGEISQTPPIYSAIKIDGKRAYKLARNGEVPEMRPRKVSIKSITIDNYDYPEVVFSSEVSSGTYIRSLVEDIGRSLETGAYTKKLIRLTVGEYSITHSISIKNINFETIESRLIVL